MRHSEVYKGTQIAITTNPTEAKDWTSRAEFSVPGQGVVIVAPAEISYPSEEEAAQAVLRAAVESIDRSRVSKGKP